MSTPPFAVTARPRPLPRVALPEVRSTRRTWSWPPMSAVAGVLILGLLAVLAILGPSLWPVDPEAQDLMHRLTPPWGLGGSGAHPLGTDTLGRDTLARLIAGTRVSLPLSVVATLAAGVAGVVLGVGAGFRGGWPGRRGTWLPRAPAGVPLVALCI